jgi:hypothetical protein
MGYVINSSLVALGLVLVMLGCLEAGRRLGQRRIARDGAGATSGLGPIDGAIFGLLGLLIAFTFSGAAQRFDARRDLIVQEANAIGTAYLRLDLLAPEARDSLRGAFRRYLDSRLAIATAIGNPAAVSAATARSNALQNDIWRAAVPACRADASPAPCTLLLPALNEMFDITTTRTMAGRTHPPPVIYAMLFGLAAASAALAGFSMGGARTRNWLHMLGLAATMGIAVYVILDIEYPRLGLIRVDDFDVLLVQLRESMN